MSGYVAGPQATGSQMAMTQGGGVIAGGGVYGPGYLAQQGGGMGQYGGYGTGGNPGMEAQNRDFAMDLVPPAKDLRRASHGVAFKTDLSKMGSGGAANQRIFGGGPTNQVAQERFLIDKVFSICDKDNSGAIDVKELKELLALCNVDASFIESSIGRIMSNSDQDRDNMISPQEFHAILSQKFGPEDSREDILKVFNKMDENKDRFLDVEEIMKISAYMGENITREEVEDMIQVFSLDYQQKLKDFKSRPRDAPKIEKPKPPVKMTEEDFVAVMHKTLGGDKTAEEAAAEGSQPGSGATSARKSQNEMMFYQRPIF